MAQGIRLDRANFCCSICLDLLNDPVTIPCGHSYCMSCIKDHLETEDHRGIHSCPQCRQTFTLRPVLVKNTMLADLVEELKKTGHQAAPADHCYAGPEDVTCDVCTERKLRAFKSCLQCVASYCEKHLQPHYDVGPLKKHKLVEASAKLQENICSRHQEVMKLFCRTDQQCICYLCSKDDHKGHNKVSTAAERTERQRELELSRQQIQQRLQDREKEVKVLQQDEDAINHSTDNAVRTTDKIFTELIHTIEKRVSDVKELIKSRQKTEVGQYKKVREKVKQEIAELKRKDADLEKLSRSEDHTHFLLNYPSLSHLGESTDPPCVKVCGLRYFEKVTVALSEARDKIQEVLGEEYAKISVSVSEVGFLPSNPQAEPKTRNDFFHYACQITLDPDTANKHLSISKGNRKAAFMTEEQKYSIHPERFVYSWQVLSKEGLTGRCYWEVEKSGKGVFIAVVYKDISRAGDFGECVFGYNDKSWALDCYKNSYEFRHNNVKTSIPGTWSSRVGVYLDHSAGILSFYSVSETMTLLHRVQTTFTQPLYAGLWLANGATAEICKLK
ncbi:tripartite motif-containing protein 16-like [Xiphias gladius]|uniref:tripartite motif-containing protein 16-like n=1 Tax=Xiphias gladius TaxID=8245 RepID=UPI001A99F917|nr:tripartite motif-containing protein 16-like [Xiphias gladius]